ncbi:MAG TPA: carboxylating nicotinate-nucleotide diphosphorylase [Methylophilaceae bacterium]|nr:carboxylating nicotinate-nucleotide diphosphorylase [Methylophilaceae bacterium]
MILPLFTQQFPRGSQQFIDLVESEVKTALSEDIGTGDLTASLIPESQITATIISRQQAVLCGIDWVNACFLQLDSNTQIEWHVDEGEHIKENQKLCTIFGEAKILLTAERCALNFLQLLSAIATQTKAYVDLVQGLKAQILDTRKTIPGLRLAQKYAVTVGGGFNQRIALYDGILIKENHIASAGGIAPALAQAFALHANVPIQIEVETLNELREALASGATNILLDDFTLADMRSAVEITSGRALLEASGNVNLQNVRQIADTGVDRISVGALTKNIQAIDLSMRIQ